MRILFLSNFYPPARPGGYTQWCYEIAEGLKARKHTIGVLTSRYEVERVPPGEQNIYRLLHLEGDLVYYRPLHFFTKRKRQRQENLDTLKQVIEDFAPDIVFVWGMWMMSKTVPALAEHLLPSRVVYYLSDYWPSAVDIHTAYWQLPAQRWFMHPFKQVLNAIAQSRLAKEAQPVLQFEHAISVSAAVRDILVEAGVPVQHARVIHGGTDTERFLDVSERTFTTGHLNLLYAGQLVEHKGVHTAIEAISNLVHKNGIDQISLTLLGGGHPDYEAYLHALVDREDLRDYVAFHAPVPRDKMPEILRQSDVLVFPSVYEEPLARMTQEAMAAGLVVVGTTTGGTKEILVEGENGLTFATEDSEGLARQLARLAADPDLCRRLAIAGRQSVLEHFNLNRMLGEIESYLKGVVAHSSHEPIS